MATYLKLNVTSKRSNEVFHFLLIIIFIVLAMISCSSSRNVLSLPIPQGWRIPVYTEVTASSDDWRKEDINRYLVVKGDFNGDKMIDEARLLLRKDEFKLGLFVFLATKNHTYNVYLLATLDNSKSIYWKGIKRVLPGQYETACGKGYWACDKNELPEISLRHDSIDYFTDESANSYFYWDDQAKTFKNVWISD